MTYFHAIQGDYKASRGGNRITPGILDIESDLESENETMWGFHHVPPRITLLALLSAVIYVGAVLITI